MHIWIDVCQGYNDDIACCLHSQALTQNIYIYEGQKALNVRKFLRSEGLKDQKVLKIRRFSRSESFEGRKVTGGLASLYREEHFVVVLHLHGLVWY